MGDSCNIFQQDKLNFIVEILLPVNVYLILLNSNYTRPPPFPTPTLKKVTLLHLVAFLAFSP